MTASLWDLSLRTTLAETASESPTPGGGSIAAVTGTLGLGLVLMALEVSAKEAPSPALAEAIVEGRQLLTSLCEYPDRDVAAFEAYLQATSLPKRTPSEQAARRTARAAAISKAAHTPLMAAELCARALSYADAVSPLAQNSVRSDLIAGADILFGAVRALLRSVAINLPHIDDLALREQLALRERKLLDDASNVYRAICAG